MLNADKITKNPWRLTLVTNPDKCNLRCTLCFLRQQKAPFGKGEMPFEIAEAAIRKYSACGLREVIPSTMGEPLLYSHFDKLILLCRELGIKLNVTTNGTFPGGLTSWADKLLPVCRDIKVSVWGLQKQTLQRLCPGLSIDEFVLNLELLSAARKELKKQGVLVSSLSLQMAVCKENRDEVPLILNLASRLGFDRVKLNRAIFLSCASGQMKKNLELDVEDCYKEKSPVLVEGTFLYPMGKTSVRSCPFLGKELWVLPDGSLERCPDPENRYVYPSKGGNPCENCRLFPKNSFL